MATSTSKPKPKPKSAALPPLLSAEDAPHDGAVVGGKALGLLRLQRLRLRVPPWQVVPTHLFDKAKRSKAVATALRALREEPPDWAAAKAVAAASAPIREAVAKARLPKALTGALAAFGDQPVAVRSSAVGEDAGERSFAGQFDTVLGAEGPAAIGAAIKRCWASAWSARVMAYRVDAGLDPLEASMAVVIQELVEGPVSGLLFTLDPADPTATTALVTSVYGLCEGVVSGGLDSDEFRASRTDPPEVLESKIVDKTERFVRLPGVGGGTERHPVAEGERTARTLSAPQVRRIVAAGLDIEQDQGRPQDIEWTLDARNRLVILQARPITGVAAPAPSDGRVRLWDNSNIVESYPGVTTPLTFSFAHHAYEIVYRLFCEAMGVPRDVIQRNDYMFQSMIGLVRGRIYYNLHSWYRMFTLLPGYSYNRRFMEQMMGVSEQADYDADATSQSAARKYLIELPRLLYVGGRMGVSLLTLERRIAGFRERFATAYGAYKNADFASWDTERLVDAYRDLERRLLWEWKAPIINDIFSMIFYGVLRRLVSRHGPADQPALQNDLLAGEGGIESVEPTLAVLKMARLVQGYKALQALFTDEPDDGEVLRLIREDERYARLRTSLHDYLERFGYRCMEELKLESTSLKDDPRFIIRMIRNYVGRTDIDIEAMHERERAVRARAEAVMEAAVPRGWRAWVYRYVLRQARTRVKERENLRFARTRVFGLAREIFNALGGRFAEAGVIDAQRDIYWLTVPEIIGFVEGTTPTTDLRAIAAVRAAEFARHAEAAEPDERFETFSAVHVGNRFARWRPPPSAPVDGVLRGTPCCPGKLRLQARVVRSPQDDLSLNGEILVAERTDPGWVPLYPSVSGLVIERGSVLSHSAIVAREMGLPTIVGVAGLTEYVKDGQEIEMDGGAGTVVVNPE